MQVLGDRGGGKVNSMKATSNYSPKPTLNSLDESWQRVILIEMPFLEVA